MDNDEFEIPDYDQLEKTNNNNNNSLNLNNSYKLPTNKKETVKQRYEEHVQATLDYRADMVESNQRSPSMPENESKQQQKPEDINVNYEELYRNAITSSDNININIDSNNSDNNNNNNNNSDELERVAMAYNAQRSKQIEQEEFKNRGSVTGTNIGKRDMFGQMCGRCDKLSMAVSKHIHLSAQLQSNLF